MVADVILIFVFCFLFGCISGWCLEVLFRKFFSKTNPEHKWLNPGLLVGPWLPIYGFGICILALISIYEEKLGLSPVWFNIVLFFGAATMMTMMELIGGEFLLRVLNMRLWDYRHLKGNIDGVICPQFFLIWGCVSVIYYYIISYLVIQVNIFYIEHWDIMTFVIGILMGFFIIDLWNSLGVTQAIQKYAKERNIVINFETVKEEAARQRKLNSGKSHIYSTRKDQIEGFIKNNETIGVETKKGK